MIVINRQVDSDLVLGRGAQQGRGMHDTSPEALWSSHGRGIEHKVEGDTARVHRHGRHGGALLSYRLLGYGGVARRSRAPRTRGRAREHLARQRNLGYRLV